jgi:hypothetical protein
VETAEMAWNLTLLPMPMALRLRSAGYRLVHVAPPSTVFSNVAKAPPT